MTERVIINTAWKAMQTKNAHKSQFKVEAWGCINVMINNTEVK